MAQVSFNEELCKGCGLCVEYCPQKIIELSEKINSMGYHPAQITDVNRCTGCAFCAMMCPDVVIRIER